MRQRKVKWTRDKRGDHRWSVVAGNGRILATSGEGYQNQADAVRALALVAITLAVYVSAGLADMLGRFAPTRKSAPRRKAAA